VKAVSSFFLANRPPAPLSGADHTVNVISQRLRKLPAVSVGLFACVGSLVSVFVLVWIGFIVWLASRLGFVENAVRRWPSVFTLGLFGREPERAALMKQTAR
jgi:hypothetical protein